MTCIYCGSPVPAAVRNCGACMLKSAFSGKTAGILVGVAASKAQQPYEFQPTEADRQTALRLHITPDAVRIARQNDPEAYRLFTDLAGRVILREQEIFFGTRRGGGNVVAALAGICSALVIVGVTIFALFGYFAN